MTTMKNSIHDNANGLDYTLVNDHYLPNLTAAAPAEQPPTGRWGRLHKMYLKEQHPIRYNQLLLSGELGGYLAKLDKQAEEQLALTVRQMQEADYAGRMRDEKYEQELKVQKANQRIFELQRTNEQMGRLLSKIPPEVLEELQKNHKSKAKER